MYSVPIERNYKNFTIVHLEMLNLLVAIGSGLTTGHLKKGSFSVIIMRLSLYSTMVGQKTEPSQPLQETYK